MTTVARSFRSLKHSPAFAAIALLALALGIGATTAIFSVVDTVLLRPLPYPEPERLVWVATVWSQLEFLVSPEYAAWREQNRVFENLAAFPHNLNRSYLRLADGPLEIFTSKVSANFFETLRVPLLLGRGFSRDEARPGGPNVVILSYGLWRRIFNGDREALGRPVVLDGQSYTVVGVMPAKFQFPERRVDAVTPLPIPSAGVDRRAMSTWNAIGRLKPGISVAEARADMERLFELARQGDPKMYRRDVQLQVMPLQAHRAKGVRLTLLVLLAAVAGVLLIACANVANLLMARGTARRRELEIRAALGAGRARLVRELLSESVSLSLLGGLAGAALAWAAARAIARFGPRSVPGIEDVSIDVRVLVFALMISIITGIAFGILPALSASKAEMPGSRAVAGAGNRMMRRALIVTEMALSMILLIGAGLLIESLWRLQNQDLGFRPENVITASLSFRGARIASPTTCCRDLLANLESLPGTTSVAIGEGLPPEGGGRMVTFSRSDRPRPEPWHRGDSMFVRRVTPGYFKTLGIRLRQGRLFTDLDRADEVAIVNETLAKRYFPNENPLGKKIDGLGGMPWKAIVGIVSDVKNHGLDTQTEAEMYSPYEPATTDTGLSLTLRTAAEPRLAVTAIQSRLRQIDNSLPFTIRTMDDRLSELVSGPRFNAVLFGTFAGIALMLALIGIYGVISYSVTRRTQEIGIRMALGAAAPDVIRLVGGEALLVTGAGLALGIGGALGVMRYLAQLLYGVKPADLSTFAIAGLLLLAAALLASYVPARRAARVDPMIALRHSQ